MKNRTDFYINHINLEELKHNWKKYKQLIFTINDIVYVITLSDDLTIRRYYEESISVYYLLDNFYKITGGLPVILFKNKKIMKKMKKEKLEKRINQLEEIMIYNLIDNENFLKIKTYVDIKYYSTIKDEETIHILDDMKRLRNMSIRVIDDSDWNVYKNENGIILYKFDRDFVKMKNEKNYFILTPHQNMYNNYQTNVKIKEYSFNF